MIDSLEVTYELIVTIPIVIQFSSICSINSIQFGFNLRNLNWDYYKYYRLSGKYVKIVN